MYAVSISAEGDCSVCVPPDPGIEAAALGARESAAPGASESAALGAAEELDLEEEGDGYLSDDSDEMFDPVVAADIASQTNVSLTLLVHVNRIAEVPRTKATIVALLDDFKDHLSPDVLQTTTYQKLQATFFSR
ncbi:unnamed protein product [Closterium sp. NIES-53]